jgi:hypothetical protein
MLLHKPTRQQKRPLHKLMRMSADRTFVFILDAFLLRTIQERIDVIDVRIHLRLEVLARRNAVVPPSLRLHDEQLKQRHDGYTFDVGRRGRGDLWEVDGARYEYVDFDAAVVGVPARQTAHEDLVRRFAESGRL